MYFEQFYLTCLAHASYMLGSEGLAAVVDPQRDVELYLEEAARQGLKIAYVIETHLHADFVSGHRELAARTGATICVGARAGAKFSHRALAEGDQIRFGRCVLKILETPGRTPESVCVLVTDLERGPEPWAVLTGDTLFIGDVGRPDLSPEHTPQQLAGMLYDSLHRKLLALPDGVEVYPAHGAGDALKSLVADLSPAKPVAVHCKSGYRSSIATSLLERAGYRGVLNVVGGFDAWQAHKLPVERSGTSREPAAPLPPASAGGS